jgi:hypothetical protein
MPDPSMPDPSEIGVSGPLEPLARGFARSLVRPLGRVALPHAGELNVPGLQERGQDDAADDGHGDVETKVITLLGRSDSGGGRRPVALRR